jgi:molybdopterin converting factor small subunit
MNQHSHHRPPVEGRGRGPQPAAGSLRIALFAGMAEAAGCRILEIAWPGGSVADLRRAVATARPEIGPLLARSAVAVEDVFAADESPVPCDAEVAIIPPVSGG